MAIEFDELIPIFLDKFANVVEEKEHFAWQLSESRSENMRLNNRIKELETIALAATREDQSKDARITPEFILPGDEQ
jgi:hypothetical protein